MVNPRVYVIIVNWNGKATLRQCLTCLLQNTPNPPTQIVVVDNGSVDGSAQMLHSEFPSRKVLENKRNLGFSKANNQGIQYAASQGAEYFLLLNNDVFVSQKDWLENMVSVMESDRSIGMVGCKLLYPDGRIQHAGGFVRVAGAGHIGDGEADVGQFDSVKFVDYVTGAAMLTKAEVIQRIGLLDEGFTPLYFEDTDWCLRASFCGYKTACIPKTALIHRHGSSAKTLRQRNNEFYFKRSWIRFFLLNFKPRAVIKRLLRYEAAALVACFVDRTPNRNLPLKARLDYPKLVLLSKAWATNLRNLKDILAKRRQRFRCRKTIL